MVTNKYLCIHGHFYQPPRENPWTEEIELQTSAFPFHDWNERIHKECYKPNSLAQIFDSKDYLIDIVNNFENISFNLGPTLMSWLEKKDPYIYQRIIEANRKSIENHNGHGNAIAQAYNHIILPLANYRDKITQIKWGLEDFKFRFGVEAESIWLPETACNEETLEALVELGVKFIILEPHQAQSIKAFDSQEWQDVNSGNIDPKVPYRCYLEKQPEKFIDIFFYDGAISRAVGFEDLLSNAHNYMQKISAAVDHRNEPQLISISTDGETYGHHKVFGDRVLGYILNIEAPQNDFHIVNYAEYLAFNPPRHIVKLKAGENDLGTSWSCLHGVKRWKEHCGCRGDGPQKWTQHWRTPLRAAFDYLRDELIIIFEKHGNKFFKDPWEARNLYINVVLNRSEENISAFINQVAKKNLSHNEIVICLKLLEMQRYAMLMYTSCAWFFSELSGIETVQVIKYAARAIEFAHDILKSFKQKSDLEKKFVDILFEAKSNIPEFKDGKYIYETFAKAESIDLERIAAHYAIVATFENIGADMDITNYHIKFLNKRDESVGGHKLSFGRILINSKTTLENEEYVFVVLNFNDYDFRCSLKHHKDFEYSHDDSKLVEDSLFEALHSSHLIELLREIDEYFGKEYYSLQSLFYEERTRIINSIVSNSLQKISFMYDAAYEENKKVNEFYTSLDIEAPKHVKFLSEFIVNKEFKEEIYKLANEGFPQAKIKAMTKIQTEATLSDIHLEVDEIKIFLAQELEKRLTLLANNINFELIIESLHILNLANTLHIEINIYEAQIIFFNFLKKALQEKRLIEEENKVINSLARLARELKINISIYLKKGEDVLQ